MADSQNLSVDKIEGGIAIKGSYFDSFEKRNEVVWGTKPLDKKRLLLYLAGSQQEIGEGFNGMAYCSIESFTAYLLGLCKRCFSGTIAIDTGKGVKRVMLHKGEICFATSNLIDDRLGEIIYRAGRINLEQMTQSSVKVNRHTRFGAVLLKNNIFSSVDLWESLRLQIQEIIKSVFLVDNIYFQLTEGEVNTPSSVYFQEGSIALLEELSIHGTMFRSFLQSISTDSVVTLNNEHILWKEPAEGTFLKDLTQLVISHQKVEDIVANSKLVDINTCLVIFEAANRGLIRVESTLDSVDANFDQDCDPALKSMVEKYNSLISAVIWAFEADKQIFPRADLFNFVHKINGDGVHLMELDEAGGIELKCLSNIMGLAHNNPLAIDRFSKIWMSVMHFVMQVAGDMLSRESSKQLREKYRWI